MNIAPPRGREIAQDYFRRPEWRGYLLALLAWGVAFALRFGLAPWFPPGFPYLTFFPAVVLVAYYAGLRPAIMAATLSGLAAWWFWIGPQGFDFGVDTLVALGFYIFVAAVDIFFIVGMDGASRRLSREIERNAALAESRDIAKEQAEAASRAKSAFLATMSHEIRTPLNGVLGMAQAMAADELSGRQRSRLDTIRQSGEVLLVVLNDVLDLSKVEAGKLELEFVDFEVSRLARTTYDAFAGVAAGRSLNFVLDVEEAARGCYRGDCGRLRQILYNLVSNALKFTESGEVRLHVGRRGEALVFTVTDTGMGIAPDRIAQVFNKFEQADASTTRRFGGTGLGLAICRELAGLMGGDIEASSELGIGSQFRLVAPLARLGDEGAIGEDALPPAPALEEGAAMRVLAAEDNGVNQLVLRSLLQQVGIDPHIVADGDEAVAAWRSQDWDVILMDVQMPVMDGLTATRAIRAAETETGRPRTPIVALTANAMAHQVAEYAAAGMDGVVAKPIRVEALFGALQATLDGEEAEAAFGRGGTVRPRVGRGCT